MGSQTDNGLQRIRILVLGHKASGHSLERSADFVNLHHFIARVLTNHIASPHSNDDVLSFEQLQRIGLAQKLGLA